MNVYVVITSDDWGDEVQGVYKFWPAASEAAFWYRDNWKVGADYHELEIEDRFTPPGRDAS